MSSTKSALSLLQKAFDLRMKHGGFDRVFSQEKSGVYSLLELYLVNKRRVEEVGQTSREGIREMERDNIRTPVKLLSGGDGKCTAQLKVEKEHQNIHGTLHGGLTASLVDTISTYALMTTERGISGSSVNIKISYLRPVKQDEVILIEAETLKVGKTLAYLTVHIRNESTGKLVATGEHIKYIG